MPGTILDFKSPARAEDPHRRFLDAFEHYLLLERQLKQAEASLIAAGRAAGKAEGLIYPPSRDTIFQMAHAAREQSQ